MPIFLISILTSLFGALVDFFTRVLTRKLAVGATFLTIMIALVAAFIAALDAAISTISYAMPSFLSEGFGLFMPSNTLLCITAIYTAQLARFIYDTNKDIISNQVRIFS